MQPNETLARFIAHLANQPDVIVAYLFGSVARGNPRNNSDLDIAVLLDAGLDEQTLIERQLGLMAVLEEASPREVQVTILNRASPSLAFQVIREGRLLYERDAPARVEFEVRMMKRYFDFQPIMEFQQEALIQRAKEAHRGPNQRGSARTLDAARRVQERFSRVSGN